MTKYGITKCARTVQSGLTLVGFIPANPFFFSVLNLIPLIHIILNLEKMFMHLAEYP